jgi:diguanylate cyclase (GGDEF)-like protein
MSPTDSNGDSPIRPGALRWYARGRQIASEHLIAIAFAFCATGMLGFGFFALHLLGRSQASDAWVLHAAVAIGKLEALHLALVETESAGRGFLIAGSHRSRSRYDSMLARIDEQVAGFKAYTSDNPDQQKLIAPLEQDIGRRFAYLDALIGLRVRSGVDAVVHATSVGTGAREMETIRTHIAEMKRIENGLLEQRRATQARDDARFEMALALLIVFGVALMGGLFLYMRRLWEALLGAKAAALDQAHHDILTGLPNRRLLHDRLRVALARANRYGDVLAVLCLDLDGFKGVNDTYGHAAGDELLRQVAGRLGKLMRTEDTAARIGGDEFVVVLSRIEDISYSELVAGRIMRNLRAPYTLHGNTVTISASVGIAAAPADGTEAAALLEAADTALYEAKKLGKARCASSGARIEQAVVTAA